MKKLARDLALCLFIVLMPSVCAQEWSWNNPNAKVLPTGDLEWSPKDFQYSLGKAIRYIDFAIGDDNADGSKEKPWKHHPWDSNATDKSKGAASDLSLDTFVFKGGITYRGKITIPQGRENVRLTCDPKWGTGPALWQGSEVVTGWKKGADDAQIPQKEDVWYADIDFLPRNVWALAENEKKISRVPLARTPNWKINNYDDIKSEWFEWDTPGHPHFGRKEGRYHVAYDTKNIDQPAEYYKDAIIWTEWGWVMGTPFPGRVNSIDVEKKKMTFPGIWGGPSGVIIRYNRYYLEDKPQYLDDPDGEFWFRRNGNNKGGRLYLRLQNDQDPNQVTIEAARNVSLIEAQQTGNIEISGITFRFTNSFWKIDALPSMSPEVDASCITIRGTGHNIRINNCLFEHLNRPALILSATPDKVMDGVAFNDNLVRYTDYGVVTIRGDDRSILKNVEVLRNKIDMVGMRPYRYGQGHAIEVYFSETLNIAGNILDRCWGSGIFVWGGKDGKSQADAPMTRLLVHHNKVTNSLLNTNDWGGIETWQGGPAYVYSNISGNPGGYWNWNHKHDPDKPANGRFGHAYYLDGAFKNYYFNNIAWGKSKDPLSPLGNTSAFQEIVSYQNTFFNNTVYNFVVGSRRQAPEAGRNKFLSNIWDSIGLMVFRHSDPAREGAQANAADAGKKNDHFAYATNAYEDNIFYDVAAYGVFESTGVKRDDFLSFQKALADKKSLASRLGEQVAHQLLRDPKNHDFRLKENSPAKDKGSKVFVPWSLYAVIGEWNFYPAGDNPTRILDEHWYMAPYYSNRKTYNDMPMFPLTGVNIDKKDYVNGVLEDWINGALKLNGKDQYAILKHADLKFKPVDKKAPVHGAKPKKPEWVKLSLPESLTPGVTATIEAEVTKVGASGKLCLNLYGVVPGSNPVMNCFIPPIKITGPGKYKFKVSPKDKKGTTSFNVVLYLTPDGTWKNKTNEAQQIVSLGGSSNASSTEDIVDASLRSPDIDKQSFLIEAFFRLDATSTNGVLIEKKKDNGYSLSVTSSGVVSFAVQGNGDSKQVTGRKIVNDGKWHHVIAECDRKGKKLNMYVDGKVDQSAEGISADLSLGNDEDITVGGTPNGRCLAVTFDFLRISLGTLQDADTTIEELYEWEFSGPFLKDFTGAKATGTRRDAGALELP